MGVTTVPNVLLKKSSFISEIKKNTDITRKKLKQQQIPVLLKNYRTGTHANVVFNPVVYR